MIQIWVVVYPAPVDGQYFAVTFGIQCHLPGNIMCQSNITLKKINHVTLLSTSIHALILNTSTVWSDALAPVRSWRMLCGHASRGALSCPCCGMLWHLILTSYLYPLLIWWDFQTEPSITKIYFPRIVSLQSDIGHCPLDRSFCTTRSLSTQSDRCGFNTNSHRDNRPDIETSRPRNCISITWNFLVYGVISEQRHEKIMLSTWDCSWPRTIPRISNVESSERIWRDGGVGSPRIWSEVYCKSKPQAFCSSLLYSHATTDLTTPEVDFYAQTCPKFP